MPPHSLGEREVVWVPGGWVLPAHICMWGCGCTSHSHLHAREGGGGPVVVPARVGGAGGGVGGADEATSPPTRVCVRREVVVVGGWWFAFACERVRWWWCEAVVVVWGGGAGATSSLTRVCARAIVVVLVFEASGGGGGGPATLPARIWLSLVLNKQIYIKTYLKQLRADAPLSAAFPVVVLQYGCWWAGRVSVCLAQWQKLNQCQSFGRHVGIGNAVMRQ